MPVPGYLHVLLTWLPPESDSGELNLDQVLRTSEDGLKYYAVTRRRLLRRRAVWSMGSYSVHAALLSFRKAMVEANTIKYAETECIDLASHSTNQLFVLPAGCRHNV